MISKLIVITDGCRFCNSKETDNNHSRWQSIQFRFNSSAEIVCNQLNFNCKIYVFSRILAEFFSLHDDSVNLNISRIFQPFVFFHIADWGSNCRLVSPVVQSVSQSVVCPVMIATDTEWCKAWHGDAATHQGVWTATWDYHWFWCFRHSVQGTLQFCLTAFH